MKKIILYITTLLLLLTKVGSSQVASIQTVEGTYGNTTVNVNLTGFTGANAIGAITLKIGFNPNVATYTGVSGGIITNGIYANNPNGNEIVISWAEVTSASVNGVAFSLNFNYTGGISPLTFNQECDISNGSGIKIQTTFLNGAITQPSLSTSATIATQQGMWSGVNEVAVLFSGFPTTPTNAKVSAINLNISYNANSLQFVGIDGLTNAIANASNGIITIVWSGTTPIDLNLVNLKLKFNYLGGTSILGFTGVNIITNANGVQIPANLASGSITQGTSSAVVDIADNVTVINNLATVPVSFTGFTSNQGSVSMNIAYNNSSLTFLGTQGISGLVSNASNGIIHLTWSNQAGANISGFDLLFNYIGGSSNLEFTGINQISNTLGVVIPVTYTNGSVAQSSTAINVNLGNTSLTSGSNLVSVPLTLSGNVASVYSTTMYVNYDYAKLTYLGVENAPSGLIANQNPTTKTIIISYANNGTSIPLVSGKLLNLKFNFNGGIGNCDVPVYFTTYNSNASSFSNLTGGVVLANLSNALVNTIAAPTASASQSFCAGATVANLIVTGTNIKWYDAINGGSLIAPSTVLVNGAQYFATQTINGCESAARTIVTATVNTLPTASISGSATINIGSSTNLTLTVTGIGSVSGTLSDGTAFSGTAPAITVTVSPSSTTTYTIATLFDANCTAVSGGLTGSAVVNVISTYSISGILKYANTTGGVRPITSTTIKLKSGATEIASTTSDATTGSFTFVGIPNGTYTYEVICTKPWSNTAVNLTDYAIIRNFVNTGTPVLSGIYWLAADVNNSNTVNLTDYALVRNRVNTSSIAGWSLINWIFDTTISTNVSGSNVSGIVINGILRGDVNANYLLP